MLFCKHLVIPLRFAWYSSCESIGIVSPTSRIYLNDIQVLIVKAMLTFMMINEINRYSFIFFYFNREVQWISDFAKHDMHFHDDLVKLVSIDVLISITNLMQLYVYTLNLTWIRLIKTSLVTFYSQRNGGCKCMYLLPMLLEIS